MLPEDILAEICDVVAATDAHGLLALARVSRLLRELARRRQFRVVCVKRGGLSDFRIAGSPRRYVRRGFPLVGYERFRGWDADTARSVRHLHLYGAALAFDDVFGRCPRVVTLWLDHGAGPARAPSLRGLDRLRHLRELTLPFAYFADGSSELLSLTVPTVTHLHFDPIFCCLRLDVRTLAAFPSLTHVGFSGQTLNGCVERTALSRASVGVVVRTHEPDFWYVHPRVVYLTCPTTAYDHGWLKRACPGWTPPGARRRRVWDQWALFDAVMHARARGRLLAKDGPIAECADDYFGELQDADDYFGELQDR